MKSSNISSLYGCEIPVNAAEKNKAGEKNQVTLPEHSQAWEDEGSYPLADRRSGNVAVWADLILTCFFFFFLFEAYPFWKHTSSVFHYDVIKKKKKVEGTKARLEQCVFKMERMCFVFHLALPCLSLIVTRGSEPSNLMLPICESSGSAQYNRWLK